MEVLVQVAVVQLRAKGQGRGEEDQAAIWGA